MDWHNKGVLLGFWSFFVGRRDHWRGAGRSPDTVCRHRGGGLCGGTAPSEVALSYADGKLMGERRRCSLAGGFHQTIPDWSPGAGLRATTSPGFGSGVVRASGWCCCQYVCIFRVGCRKNQRPATWMHYIRSGVARPRWILQGLRLWLETPVPIIETKPRPRPTPIETTCSRRLIPWRTKPAAPTEQTLQPHRLLPLPRPVHQRAYYPRFCLVPKTRQPHPLPAALLLVQGCRSLLQPRASSGVSFLFDVMLLVVGGTFIQHLLDVET